jgi:Asp-tRNA(Asn)/Glu-tRNA(Gln) amidotransferase A subunit family amidase
MAPFNRLTTTASELQALLQQGTLTSVDAVDAYLEQIDRHNDWLKAVIATPPRDQLAARAKFLDDECKQGKTRGPLHGIPVLIKVGGANVLCTSCHVTDSQRTPSTRPASALRLLVGATRS